MMKFKTFIKEYSIIFLGSLLYALSTVLFIFPNGLLLGGTQVCKANLVSCRVFARGRPQVSPTRSDGITRFFVKTERTDKSKFEKTFCDYLNIN